MLEFKQSMDPHSLDIMRNGKFIGFLQWHPERAKAVVLSKNFEHITLSEMKECVAKLESSQCDRVAIEYVADWESLNVTGDQVYELVGLAATVQLAKMHGESTGSDQVAFNARAAELGLRVKWNTTDRAIYPTILFNGKWCHLPD